MEVSIAQLITSTATLFCFMFAGFILKKTKLAGEGFAKTLSILCMYVCQVCMFLRSYIYAFEKSKALELLQVGIASFAFHGLFYVLARLLFKKYPDKIRKLATFSVIFSNSGYIGLPLVERVFGDEYTIYGTLYLVAFNMFAFTLGRLIFTEDKSYISVKKVFVNPAVIPITIGLVIYFTGCGGVLVNAAAGVEGTPEIAQRAASILIDVLSTFKHMVAPVSMVMIGIRLAETDFIAAIKDKAMYVVLIVRLLAFPTLAWLLCTTAVALGIMTADVRNILVILSATPIAAMASMFSELYDGDKVRAGQMVAVSTLLSIVTMPIIALLLKINF